MLDIQKYIGVPKIVVDELGNSTTRFEVRFLPRGFGHTIGNAFRRVMLGYDVGAAVTALKVKGYTHEYQVIDGVKESVIDVALNIKQLRFKVDDVMESMHRVSQKFSGVGVYTAQHIKLPSGIELMSTDVYLCEITDPGVKVEFELRIEKGYGYYSVDYLKSREEQAEDTDINLILIDNDFRLVDYVKYDVEEVIDDFMGGSKDKLLMEIKMKYEKASARDFVAFAGEVLASYAKLFIFDDAYIDRSMLVDYEHLEKGDSSYTDDENVRTMPIDALPLSERTRNALIKNEVLYVEDLEKKKKGELLLMKGVGRKAIDEINSALSNIGKALAG